LTTTDENRVGAAEMHHPSAAVGVMNLPDFSRIPGRRARMVQKLYDAQDRSPAVSGELT
jgi:hypothetical protein